MTMIKGALPFSASLATELIADLAKMIKEHGDFYVAGVVDVRHVSNNNKTDWVAHPLLPYHGLKALHCLSDEDRAVLDDQMKYIGTDIAPTHVLLVECDTRFLITKQASR